MIIYDSEDEEEDSLNEAIITPIRLWEKIGTKVIIPYTVPQGLSDHQQTQIRRAMTEFHQKTCIR